MDIVGFKDRFGSAVFRDVDHGAGQLLGCGQAKGYRIPDLGALACAVSTETAASPRLRWLKTTSFASKSPERLHSENPIGFQGVRTILKKGDLSRFELRLCLATVVPLVESELLR